MYKIILLRHGLSDWNKQNLFTGWEDIDLNEEGIQEAHEAAELLKENGFTFDLAFTSVLKRAINTLSILLSDMHLTGIQIEKSWRLNERHYGTLQGLNKDEVKRQYGEELFKAWRRGYATRPPAVLKTDKRYPGNDPLYGDLSPLELPTSESLKDTYDRFLPYWHEEIAPQIKKRKKIIICTHGNLIRALVKYLDNVSDNDIAEFSIETGIPLVYELDEKLAPIRHYYLEKKVKV
ncbi:MAG: 2,3-diphosphoglycerate-dependent phosphoglycerate mutase [Patescibacteria group bacterium]|nr:2,3-diphosphoglycerate-dependent phosphoglycerate mutase [bacterium]MDZ4240935.1 2,3-diphosphoglycerate-dependent phosphoglycerate mutase [Patescibacteria group bacterium]